MHILQVNRVNFNGLLGLVLYVRETANLYHRMIVFSGSHTVNLVLNLNRRQYE
jgi:hypothetical protein